MKSGEVSVKAFANPVLKASTLSTVTSMLR